MAVTRIKNNQITDSTITYHKITPGTLVGSLFNANLTLNSNVNIIGDLYVTGNTTTVGSTETIVTNPLLVLNESFVGIPSYDVGIIFNRDLGSLGTYGGVNSAIVWSESEGAFVTVLTTETGTTVGSISKPFKANLSVGNLAVANAINAQSLTVSSLNTSSFSVSNFLASGNIVAASGTPSVSINSGAIVVPNGGGVGISGKLNVGGDTVLGGNLTVDGSLVSASTAFASINNTPVGNSVPSTGSFTTLSSTTLSTTNFVTGNAAITGGYVDNLVIGANTSSAGSFTNVSTTGNIGVGGNLSVTQNVVISGNLMVQGDVTSVNTSQLDVEDINITLAKGATTSAMADGGGITIDGANATFTYASSDDSWNINKKLNASLISVTTANLSTVNSDTTTTTNLNTTNGNITSLSVSNLSSSNVSITGGYADNLVIGANSKSSASFTSLLSENGGFGGLQAVSIGNISPGTGTFTTITVGNLVVADGAVFNDSRSTTDTVVRGVSDSTLLVIHPSSYDQVAIGGNLTTANIQLGAKLQINSTDSLLIPVGTSAQRPSSVGYSDVDGMIRYNTTINSLEYYGSGQWNTAGTNFTVITSRSFSSETGDINGNVNGTNTIFTLPSSSTTNGTIVSVNGVVQSPFSAYTVSGSTLTLSEAPLVGDLVDVRVLLTTSTVSSLSSPNGLNTVTLSDNGVGLYTGNLSLGSTEAWRVAVNGDFVPVGGNDIGTAEFRVPNIRASRVDIQSGVDLAPAQKYIPPSGSSVIASFDSNIYRSGKFHLQLSDTIGGSYQALEALVVHNGTTASVSYYANVSTSGSELASFSANVFSGNVYVNATSLGANLSVKAGSTLMKI